MKEWYRPLFIIASATVLGLIILLVVHSTIHAAPAPTIAPEISYDAPDQTAVALERDIQAQLRARGELDNIRAKRAAAGAKMVQVRKDLLFLRQTQWSDVITTNWSKFEALRQAAATAPDHWVACHICDGRGQMNFCIVCDNSGKCAECQGTGKISSDDLCPACFGTGKCFFCTGSGMMACPFCDDGMVSANQQNPPEVLTVQ